MNELQLETLTRLRVAVEKDASLNAQTDFDMSGPNVSTGTVTMTVNAHGVIRHGRFSLTTYQAIERLTQGMI